jgi:hypothetical protein
MTSMGMTGLRDFYLSSIRTMGWAMALVLGRCEEDRVVVPVLEQYKNP